MAQTFNATAILQVDSAGSDTTNAGGFDPAATFATDLAATLATGSSPVVTSASYNFITRDNAQYLFIKAGTNWVPGLYPVVSTSGNAATLNAAVGAIALYLNGAFTTLNTTAGCATTASPTGGTWGMDYSQSATPVIAFTDMVIDGTTNTKFTSALNPVGPHMVGNLILVTSGTGFTVQRTQVLSVSGTTATCYAALGTVSSTGGNAGLGGCLASPGKAAGVKVSNISLTNPTFLKAGTYSLSTSSNTAGGEIADVGGLWIGYNTRRTTDNRDAARPLFNASANSRVLFSSNGSVTMTNVDFNANSKTGCMAFQCGAYNMRAIRCTAAGAFTNGFYAAFHACTFVDCYTTGCVTGFSLTGGNGNIAIGCTAAGGTTGFTLAGIGCSAIDCIAAGNGTLGFGTASGGSGTLMLNCSAYNNGTSGSGANFYTPTGSACIIRNCIAYTASGSGSVNYRDATGFTQYENCAGGNANAGNFSGLDATAIVENFIPLTANPFASVSTDFSLNSTAGGGALCRAAGFPGAFTGLTTTTSYPDLGAVQSASAVAGGLLTHIGMEAGCNG